MKKAIFLGAVVGAVVFWWLNRKPIEVPQSSQPIPAAVSKPVAIASKPSKVMVPKKKVAAAPPGSENVRVPFKVIDGFAVAYGDILLGTPEDETIQEGFFEAPKPEAWDREIAYHIQPDVPKPARIKQAMEYLEKQSSLHFVPYQDQKDAIVFQSAPKHCLSLLGRQGGMQPIRLSSGCTSQEILHEILHALGFVHEHSRLDRDEFVEVLWDNIEPEYKLQFEKVPEAWMGPTLGTPFDTTSVMMYGAGFFAKEKGLQTLRPRGQNVIQPVKQGLSTGDLERLRRLYPQ